MVIHQGLYLDEMDPHTKKQKSMKLSGKACLLLSDSNQFRRLCGRIVSLRYFDTFILLMIFASTVLLALDNPLDDPKGDFVGYLTKIDYFMTAVFTFEMVIKIIMWGFMCNGKESYMRNPWNIMDFLIVIFSLISVTF